MLSTATSSSIKYIDNLSLGREYDHLFKCLLLGDSATGKSSLCDRQVERVFDMRQQSVPTCGVDFKVQAFDWEGKLVKLQIWDTAGQERFRAIVNSYYRGASGILLCYDITDPTTAENVKAWLIEIEKYAPPNVPIVLVGTKVDLQDDPYQAENILLTQNIITDILASYPDILQHCETSSKTGVGVEDAFLKLVDCMLKQEARAKRERESANLDKQFQQQQTSSNFSWGISSLQNVCSLVVKKPYKTFLSNTCGT